MSQAVSCGHAMWKAMIGIRQAVNELTAIWASSCPLSGYFRGSRLRCRQVILMSDTARVTSADGRPTVIRLPAEI